VVSAHDGIPQIRIQRISCDAVSIGVRVLVHRQDPPRAIILSEESRSEGKNLNVVGFGESSDLVLDSGKFVVIEIEQNRKRRARSGRLR
jgi:hypothetical protein